MKILSERYRVASKDHICDYSGYVIPKGQRYYHLSCDINGDVVNAKVSISCLSLIDKECSFLISKPEMLVSV